MVCVIAAGTRLRPRYGALARGSSREVGTKKGQQAEYSKPWTQKNAGQCLGRRFLRAGAVAGLGVLVAVEGISLVVVAMDGSRAAAARALETFT